MLTYGKLSENTGCWLKFQINQFLSIIYRSKFQYIFILIGTYLLSYLLLEVFKNGNVRFILISLSRKTLNETIYVPHEISFLSCFFFSKKNVGRKLMNDLFWLIYPDLWKSLRYSLFLFLSWFLIFKIWPLVTLI